MSASMLECCFCGTQELLETANILGQIKRCTKDNAWTCPTCLACGELLCLFCSRPIYIKRLHPLCRNGTMCFVCGIKLLHKSDELTGACDPNTLVVYQPKTTDLRYLPEGSKIVARDKKTISIQLGDDPDRYPVCHAICVAAHEALMKEKQKQEKSTSFIPPSDDDPWDKPDDEDWHSQSDSDSDVSQSRSSQSDKDEYSTEDSIMSE